MNLTTLEKLLQEEVKDLYNAESQLVKALPKIAKQASSDQLREALEHHLEETEGQVERLERIGEILGMKVGGKRCEGMEGLIEEGKHALEAEGDESVIDAAIIAGAQKVEHYEIASYGTARAIAEQLGQDEVAQLLQESLDEEGEANKKLTEIAEGEVYPNMMETAGEEGVTDTEEGEDEEEEEMASSRARGNGRRKSSRRATARRR